MPENSMDTEDRIIAGFGYRPRRGDGEPCLATFACGTHMSAECQKGISRRLDVRKKNERVCLRGRSWAN